MTNLNTPGERFRNAVSQERPLQVVGAVNAYALRGWPRPPGSRRCTSRAAG